MTGDLVWEYRRDLPDDVAQVMGGLIANNRNVAIYGTLIIDTSNGDWTRLVLSVLSQSRIETLSSYEQLL